MKEAAGIVQGRCGRVMQVAREELYHNPSHYEQNQTQVIQTAVRNLNENCKAQESILLSSAVI